MVLDIVFDVEQPTVRLVELSPFGALIDLGHHSAPGRDLVRDAWMARIADRLGDDAPEVMWLVRSGIVQWLNAGLDPTVNEQFDGSLDRVTSCRKPEWHELMHQQADAGIVHLLPPALVAGSAHAMGRLRSDLSAFYAAAFGPQASLERIASRRAFAAHAEMLARLGPGGYLSNVHPDVRWEPPILNLRIGVHCHPTCVHQAPLIQGMFQGPIRAASREVSVEVSVFADRVTCTLRDGFIGIGLPALPASGYAPLLGDDAVDEIGPLVDLIGRTRSWVLLALRGRPQNTGQLARAVGISSASASEHASALRAAGLVSSQRLKSTVMHSITDLGDGLIDAIQAQQ